MSLDQPTLLTTEYMETARARAVPYAFYQSGGWYLPPDPDPESARIALRLFPKLNAAHPELVARARLSTCDHTPIDLATDRWRELYPQGRAMADDPWRRITAQVDAGIAAWHPPLVPPLVPHEFQRIDADYAIETLGAGKGAYFGWEMGLGKTLGACMVIDGWDANFIVIACPNSAKHDPWELELARFCPWLTVVVVGNGMKAYERDVARAAALMDAGEPTAVIVHYEALWRIEKLLGPKTVSGWRPLGKVDLLISDEAHLYKERTAKFCAAARRFKTVGRLNLSGSVMSGDAERLFVPWQMFMPKRYRSQHRDWNVPFMEVVEGDYGQIILGPKMHALPSFKRELGEVLTIRLAKDWLDIPEPHVVLDEVALYPEQVRVYHEVADDLLAELPDGDVIAVNEGAPLRAGLRRVTGGIPRADGKPGLLSAKHDKAMERIEAAGDSQVVVFAWHKRVVYEMQRRCTAAGIGCGVVCGDTTQHQRDVAIDLFKRGGTRVLIATMATLSMAANLQNASVVITLEDSDDPIDGEQSIGRVVRQGQTVHASVFRIRAKDTVDDLEVWSNAVTKAELRAMVLGSRA